MTTIFKTDEQTTQDLNILPKHEGDLSIFGFFRNPVTKGGQNELIGMLQNPINDLAEINSRLSTIQFISDQQPFLLFNNKHLEFIENYMNQDALTYSNNIINTFISSILYKIKPTNEYFITERSLEYLQTLTSNLFKMYKSLDKNLLPNHLTKLK